MFQNVFDRIAHESSRNVAASGNEILIFQLPNLTGGKIVTKMFIDLHIHSTASDGTDSPKEIAEKILLTDEEINALKLLTHDEKISYFDYVKNISADELARQVKIADLNHNSDLSRIPEEMRTSKDLRRVEKYSQALKILKGD